MQESEPQLAGSKMTNDEMLKDARANGTTGGDIEAGKPLSSQK